MNEFWNLDPLYKGFDDPAFEADIGSAKGTFTDLRVGDRVHCLTDARGRICYILIVGRPFDGKIAYNVSRQWDSTNKVSKRQPNADGVYTLGYSGKLTVNGVEQEKAIGNKTFEWLKRVDTIVLPLAENSEFFVAIAAEPETPTVTEPTVTEPTVTDAPATNAPAATTAKPAETTKAPTAEVTTAPTTTEAPKSTGCGASAGIISVLLISAIASGAALTLRKKED